MRVSQYNLSRKRQKRSSSTCRCDANAVMLVQTIYKRQQQQVRQYVFYSFISVNNRKHTSSKRNFGLFI